MKTIPPASPKSLICISAAIALASAGCVVPRPLKAGRATAKPAPGGGLEQTIVQSENPLQTSKQGQETTKCRTYTIPPGSRIEERSIQSRPAGPPLTNVQIISLSAPMPVVEREETRAQTELGAAQKDTARELTARLASLKSIVWVGLALTVFGLASLFWPPLKLLVGSLTTSAALVLGGLALIILPTLVVGNELLILSGVALGVGAWFLAHRHGHARGTIEANQRISESSQSEN